MKVSKEQIKKQILLIEDDEIQCHLLAEVLLHEGYCVHSLLRGEGLPKVMQRSGIRLVILDLMLPGKDGLYWLKWLKAYYPAVPVIITSAKIKPNERVEGLEGGAVDYLVKPFHDRELLLRVSNVLCSYASKRMKAAENDQISIGQVSVDLHNHQILTTDGEVLPLTQLECKLLQMFYLNAGIPLSREELVTQILGIPYHPLNRTIDTHVNRIRNKIEKDPSKPEYLRTIRGKGYCLHLPDE